MPVEYPHLSYCIYLLTTFIQASRHYMFFQPSQFKYIDNTDWLENPSRCIHRGRPFAGPGSRGRRLPRPWACKRPPEMDTACEDFLPRLYCIYFTSWSRIACFVSVFCVFSVCILSVLCCLLPTIGDSYTDIPHVFPSGVTRNMRCAYSMVPEQHKTGKIQAQNR